MYRSPRVSPPLDQKTICTQHCGARCCRYISVPVATPRARADWDRLRWWLAHEGTVVTRDTEGWMLFVATRCGHLGSDNLCTAYPHHMDTCKEYDAATCEYTGPLDYDLELESPADLADYLEQRGLVRGRPIAQAIRRAARGRSGAQPAASQPVPTVLVPLHGLASEGPNGPRSQTKSRVVS